MKAILVAELLMITAELGGNMERLTTYNQSGTYLEEE